MAKSVNIDFQFIGAPELAKAFSKLDSKQQAKAFKEAAKESAKPVLHAAKGLVKRRDGNLERTLKIKVFSNRRGVGAYVSTGTRKQLKIPPDAPGYYPMHLETGTSKMPAYPYLRPALAQTERIVLQKLGKAMGDAIERAWNSA